MQLTNIILLAMGLAADACAVSLSSGLAIKRIKLNKALKIALFFGFFQALMPLIGWLTGLSFRNLIGGVDGWVAFGVLSFLGGKMIYESLQEEEKKFNPLDTYTLFGLAIATSIDALAVGLSLSILKTPILSAAAVIGIVTFGLSLISVYLGHTWKNFCKYNTEIIGGTILIFIGFKILLTDLHIIH